ATGGASEYPDRKSEDGPSHSDEHGQGAPQPDLAGRRRHLTRAHTPQPFLPQAGDGSDAGQAAMSRRARASRVASSSTIRSSTNHVARPMPVRMSVPPAA